MVFGSSGRGGLLGGKDLVTIATTWLVGKKRENFLAEKTYLGFCSGGGPLASRDVGQLLCLVFFFLFFFLWLGL